MEDHRERVFETVPGTHRSVYLEVLCSGRGCRKKTPKWDSERQGR